MNTKAVVFDAYGTLFDVNSAAEKCKEKIGNEWEAFARKNPYLAKYYNKKMPGYFFIALETWNSELDFDTCNPFVEII